MYYSKTSLLRSGGKKNKKKTKKHTNRENVRSEVRKNLTDLTAFDICEKWSVTRIDAAQEAHSCWADRAPRPALFAASASLCLHSLKSAWVSSFFGQGILATTSDMPTRREWPRHKMPMHWCDPSSPRCIQSFSYCIVFKMATGNRNKIKLVGNGRIWCRPIETWRSLHAACNRDS